VLQALAAPTGWQVDREVDAEQALRRVAEGTFDAVVVDIALLGMAVFEIVKRIRSLAPQTRIVLTGEEEYLREASQYPWLFDALLSKPVRGPELSKVLAKAMNSDR